MRDSNNADRSTPRSWVTRRAFVQGGAAALALGPRLLRAADLLHAVATPLGQLRGEILPGGVRVFRGVPFAEAPVGALRFKPTTAKQPWTGVREALHFAPAAMQEGDKSVPQNEDCLYLNVWAPAAAATASPVFVWIHGGGFTGGNSFAPIFDGEEFARGGIVLVTVAYRLGVFGFMDLGPLLGAEYAGSGNNAMRDLVEALRWVQANIAAFGGDPGRVTVGGESAGAKATAALMGLPEAAGLFHSAISESGGGERVLTLPGATEVAEQYGELWRAAHPVGSKGATLPELKTASADDLIAVQRRLLETSERHFPFRSEVDGTYLKARPVDLVAAGSARGKRLLIGSNRDESALFLGPHPEKDPAARDLGNLSLAKFNAVFAKYTTVFPEMLAEQRRVRAVTAEEYWVPSIRLAEAHVRAGGTAWMYRLDFTRETGRYAGEAYHSEDLQFVWDRPEGKGADEAGLAGQMHAAWAAFVRGEPPSAAGLPPWPQYNPRGRPTMVLDRTSRVEMRPQEAELRLWDGVL